MLLLNFAHPITEMQLTQIKNLTGSSLTQTINIKTQFDEQQPFSIQVNLLIAEVPLTPEQWQTEPILVVLPALNFIAAALLAELHGRMGYFPDVVRTRPIERAVPRQYEVAEVLHLQAIRDDSRKER